MERPPMAQIGVIHAVDPVARTCVVQSTQGVYTGVPLPDVPNLYVTPKRGAVVHLVFDKNQRTPSISYAGSRRPARPRTWAAGGPAITRPSAVPMTSGPTAHIDAGEDFAGVVSSTGSDQAGVTDGSAFLVSGQTHLMLQDARGCAQLLANSMELFLGGGHITSITDDVTGTSTIKMSYASTTARSDPTKETWEVVLSAGNEPAGMLAQVRDAAGEEVYRMHVSGRGHLGTSAQSMRLVLAGLLEIEATRVRAEVSDMDLVVRGNMQVSAGSVQVSSTGRTSIRSAKDASLSAAGIATVRGMQGVRVVANGSLLPNPLSESVGVDGVNGSVNITAGDPLLGDVGTARSGVNVFSYNGDVRLTTLLGGVSIDSTIPGGVKIGGPPLSLPPAPALPGPLAGTLFEPLFVWAQAFGLAVDTHIHPVPPGGGATAPAIVPPFSSTQGLLPAARSIFVTFGG